MKRTHIMLPSVALRLVCICAAAALFLVGAGTDAAKAANVIRIPGGLSFAAAPAVLPA